MVKVLFLCPSRMQQFRISNEKKSHEGIATFHNTYERLPQSQTPKHDQFLVVCPISSAFNSMTHVHEACWRGALQKAEHAMHRPSMNENNAMRQTRTRLLQSNQLRLLSQTRSGLSRRSLAVYMGCKPQNVLYKEARTISSFTMSTMLKQYVALYWSYVTLTRVVVYRGLLLRRTPVLSIQTAAAPKHRNLGRSTCFGNVWERKSDESWAAFIYIAWLSRVYVTITNACQAGTATASQSTRARRFVLSSLRVGYFNAYAFPIVSLYIVSANLNVKVHLPFVVVVVFKIQYAVMLADVQSQIRLLEQCASVIAGRRPAPYSPWPITIQENCSRSAIFTIFTLLLILDSSIISVLTCVTHQYWWTANGHNG